MLSFELTTHRPERSGLFRTRPARELQVHDADGNLVLASPEVRRATRRAEYALRGHLGDGATMIRTSWGKFRLVGDGADLARFVLRSPRPGRKMRPSWEIHPTGGERIVIVSDVPFSTLESLKRDLRDEILTTYSSGDGFQLDVYPGRAELKIEAVLFGASVQVAVAAAVIIRALHQDPSDLS